MGLPSTPPTTTTATPATALSATTAARTTTLRASSATGAATARAAMHGTGSLAGSIAAHPGSVQTTALSPLTRTVPAFAAPVVPDALIEVLTGAARRTVLSVADVFTTVMDVFPMIIDIFPPIAHILAAVMDVF